MGGGVPCQGGTLLGVPCPGGTLLGGTLPGGYPAGGVTLLGGYPAQGGTLPGGYPAGGVLGGYPAQGGTLLGGYPAQGGGTLPPYHGGGSYLSGVQAATELFCCELALYTLMPHGIMGNVAKDHGSKKKNYGMGTPPWTDRLMDGWMDRHVSKHYLPVVLRTRAVNMMSYNFQIMLEWRNTLCF